MKSFLFVVFGLFLFASCGELSSRNDSVGQPKVVLTQRTDTSSVWLVYNTNQPDTMFVDIEPEIGFFGTAYVGYGFGYQPVYKAVYRHEKSEE